MDTKIITILENAQTGSSNHQKNIKLLENIYNSSNFEEFLSFFLNMVQTVLQEDYRNPCVKLVLEFCAKFVAHIAKVQNEEEVDPEEDTPSHPFLAGVTEPVLKHHNIPIDECRYNACSFVSLTLQSLGDNVHLDGHVCDLIQIAMLENIQDSRPLIRLQAVLALTRLQDPLNPECPVIKAYIQCLKDSNALVRREAVKRIAPNALTIPKVKERTTDRDCNVRCAAFTRCADIGLKHFKIVHRQFILKSGFSETNKFVKKIFFEYFLPKWLTSLNGEYLAFLNAIKLDAEESDVLNTEELSKQIMEVFFKTEPINNLIEALPLDDNKIIPLSSMKSELAHYWNILSTYLRKSDELDEFLDIIIPELTAFCNYMEKIINTKTSKTMEDWEYMDFQCWLYYLFDIVEHYDLSEEVGRRTLDNLLKTVLRNHKFQPRLINKIVKIARQLSTSVDSFTNEMCIIMSDIREPLIEQEPSPNEKREKEFKLAELTVKLNILEGDLEDAVDQKEFQKASVLKNEIDEYRRKMEALNVPPTQSEKVRVSKDDPETICWCLDLLLAVLIHSEIKTLPPSLVTCREEFLNPLKESKNAEIGWRVFKCLAAYCVFDKKMAEDHAKALCVPIASYRVIPNFNKSVLIVSVSAVSDLIRMYGTNLFTVEEDQNPATLNANSTRRRLYTEDFEDVNVITNQMTLEVIINVILDMLDDENGDIRDTAITAIAKLILNEFAINPMVMTRLILKWYNPITRLSEGGLERKEKRRMQNYEKNLQQKLGVIIKEYTEKIKGSRDIVAKSVIPIITNLAEAPKTSPLAEVDIDNAVRFLAAITDTRDTNDLGYIHRSLAHSICREISTHPAENITPYLAKMLNYLNIAADDLAPTRELIGTTELLLDLEVLDKGPRQNIIKFIAKLNGDLSRNTTNISNTTGNESNNQSAISNNINSTVSRRLSRVIEENEIEVEVSKSSDSLERDQETDGAAMKRTKLNHTTNKNSRQNENNPSKRKEVDKDTGVSIENDQNLPNTIENPALSHTDRVEGLGKGKEGSLPENAPPSQGKSPSTDSDVIPPSISPEDHNFSILSLRKRTRSNNSTQKRQNKAQDKENNKSGERSVKKARMNNVVQKRNDDVRKTLFVDASPSSKSYMETRKLRVGSSKNKALESQASVEEDSVGTESDTTESSSGPARPRSLGNNQRKHTDTSTSSESINFESTRTRGRLRNVQNGKKALEKQGSDFNSSISTESTGSKSNKRRGRSRNINKVLEGETACVEPVARNRKSGALGTGKSNADSSVNIESSGSESKKRPRRLINSESKTTSGRFKNAENRKSVLGNQASDADTSISTDSTGSESNKRRGRSRNITDKGSKANSTSTVHKCKENVSKTNADTSISTDSTGSESNKRSGQSKNLEGTKTDGERNRKNISKNQLLNVDTSVSTESTGSESNKRRGRSRNVVSNGSESQKRIERPKSFRGKENNNRNNASKSQSSHQTRNRSRSITSLSSTSIDIIKERKIKQNNSKSKYDEAYNGRKKTVINTVINNRSISKEKNGEKITRNNGVKAVVEARVNGVHPNVLNLKNMSLNETQVKRKKQRGRKSKSLMNESLDTSVEQTLHTIIEPTQNPISLLLDESPENTPASKKANSSRRLLVVVSETSSDSDSPNTSIRKSARKIKKKTYNGFI